MIYLNDNKYFSFSLFFINSNYCKALGFFYFHKGTLNIFLLSVSLLSTQICNKNILKIKLKKIGKYILHLNVLTDTKINKCILL